MASIWAGYRYFLLGFLLLDTFFILIISAQNVQTGRLVGGGEKSNIYTLIVSLFSGIFLAVALWFDLQKRQSKIAEVRWELIWVAAIILFNIIGFASIASNKPAPNTCNGPNSAWNICAASQGLLALLALSIIALIAHASALIVLVVKLSRRTEYSVWAYMAWGLLDALDPPQPIVTTTNVPLSLDGMANIDLGRPVSKALPNVPPDEPSPISWRRRDPFTFSSVSSLLNPAPRELPRTVDGRFQLYDTPVPIPVDRPPVQRAFERVSGYMGDAPSFSMYYAPTPVYDKFARGKTPGDSPTEPVPPTPKPMPSPPKKIQKRDGKWMLADEEEAIERPPLGEESVLPARYASLQQPPPAHTAPVRRPTRTPPRVAPGSLPNPNMHRPNRI